MNQNFTTGLKGTAKEVSQIAAVGIGGTLLAPIVAESAGVLGRGTISSYLGEGFAYNGLRQGSINLSLSFAGNLAAYGGSFADAYDNLDLADGVIGFATGGFSGTYSLFGSFYNVIGGSLIDYEPGDGYQTFGGFFGGAKKDPWKVVGDIVFNSIGLGLEMNLVSRQVWTWSFKSGEWTAKWTLPKTFSNEFSEVIHGVYGSGFGDFLNETFNNNKPRVIKEYGFQGTKRR